MKSFSLYLFIVLQLTVFSAAGQPTPTPVRDGSHDFDFLIGNWKAHVRRLPDRLVGSNNWIEYNGISNHKKLLDSNANFEEFEVDNPEKHLHIKGQTLRLYNPDSHQWSIYLLDLDKGVLVLHRLLGNLMETVASFMTRNNTRVGPFWCATFGKIFHRKRREWNNPSRLTAERHGKQTGSAN